MMQRIPQNVWRHWLKEQMDHKGWKHQSELVRAAGVPQSAVSQWLLRDDQQPSIENARKVAGALGVSLLEVLIAAGYITPEEARIQASGETTLREASLHQLLLQAQLRSAALQKEVEALHEGRNPEDDEWSHGDVPGLNPGGSASSSVENQFF